MTTAPALHGRDTFRSDRGMSSVTQYWDDRSSATVYSHGYAGTAIEYAPEPPKRARSIWWVDHDELAQWLAKQAPQMPDHIWNWLAEQLPNHDLTPRRSIDE